MPEMQVPNPQGAFNTSSQVPTPYYPGQQEFQFVATGTIAAGQIVTFDTTGNGTVIVCTAALNPIGVALTSAVAGGTVDVCTKGYASTLAGAGGITKNTLVGVLAAGAGGPASATVGLNVGIAVTTAIAAANAIVFVQPM